MAKHAKHEKTEEQSIADGLRAEGPDVEDAPADSDGRISYHRAKSRRMRIALSVVVAVLAVLIAALGYFAWMLVGEARDVAYQSAVQSNAVELQEPTKTEDAGTSAEARKETPELVSLIGKTEEEAVASIGRGATETSSSDITEETGEGDEKTAEVVGRKATLALTDETTDSRGNTPSVYLTIDKDGYVTEAGYSASVKFLGYGEVSFVDAVQSEHLVENLVSMAGVPLEKGEVQVPAVEEYRSYADDGKTIAQEVYTFSGAADGTDGVGYSWSCKLSYDYSSANVSGNLADTIRQVYLYVKKA